MQPQRLEFMLPTLEGSPSPHRLACWQWGDASNPSVLVCVHGLTRQGRDFEFLAHALCGKYRILAPDMPGRGESDFLSPGKAYNYGQYMADINGMLHQLGVTSCDWVGTSMGGIIGMMMASLPSKPVGKLVLNDVGALIPKESLLRIRDYVGKDMEFVDWQGAEKNLRAIFVPWGMTEEVQWQHVMEHSLKPNADGGWRLHYDPAIAEVFFSQNPLEDIDLNPVWEKVTCPVLILRGAQSDLLLREVAQKMAASRSQITLVEIANTGHAPHLMDAEQIGLIKEFLA